MFHRKFTIKESHRIGKKDIKKLKDDVTFFGPEFSDICESLLAKKNSILKQVWKIGNASAALYLIDQVPLFISVLEFPNDIDAAFSRLPKKSILLPTVFLILTLRLMLHETSQNMIDLFQNIGLSVSCHAATSKHILSGAHLMMPGIISCCKTSSLEPVEGSIALIYTYQNDIPFAVGLATRQLVTKSKLGIGVYIISCFNDLMWKHFHSSFIVKSLTLSVDVNPVPNEFSQEHILSVKNEAEDSLPLDDVEKPVYDTAEEALPEIVQDSGIPSILDGAHQLFPDEESILKFCFCEAVKSIKPSMLPLPLSEFTAIFCKSYPLISPDSTEINLRKTHAKKALLYFRNFPDVIEITEVTDGNYVVAKKNGDASLLRDHNSKYATFIKEVHEPMKQQLAQKNQLDKLSDFSTVVLPKILSVSELYFIGRDLDQDFVVSFFEESSAMQTAAQTSELSKTTSIDNIDKPLFDPNILKDGLTSKQILNALNKYIVLKKLITPLNHDSKIPLVRLDVRLSQFACSDLSEMLITTLRERILRRFTLKHKFVWKPFVQNNSMGVDDIHSHFILANGPPPIVKISTKVERLNKIITIVENLDHYGLDFHTVSTFFRKKLATSCFEYSQSGKVETLKGGKKNKLQIAVKGDMKNHIRNLVLNEFGIPPQYVN